MSMPGAYKYLGEEIIAHEACKARVRAFVEWHN
jgi:hypothetical protein